MIEGFDFNDLQILPEVISDISSRSECDVYINGKLPLITAPMYDVIDENNVDDFNAEGIITILPRNKPHSDKFDFVAYGLHDEINVSNGQGILIDIANGHMTVLVDRIKEIKKQFPNSPLMVGNIARPETFKILSEAGADFIRVGIGGGSMCLTSTNTGIGCPLPYLIEKCKYYKDVYDLSAKIVADGGLRTYTDIIKALALGADYCMVGGIFAKAMESTAEKYVKFGDEYVKYNSYEHQDCEVYSKYSGMSTKDSQRKMGNTNLKTSEGTTRYVKVDYTLNGWINNFTHYLKSAMSYTNSRTLADFKDVAFIKISNNAFKRIDK